MVVPRADKIWRNVGAPFLIDLLISATLPKNLNYVDYLLPIEIFYGDVDVLHIASNIKGFIQSR